MNRQKIGQKWHDKYLAHGCAQGQLTAIYWYGVCIYWTDTGTDCEYWYCAESVCGFSIQIAVGCGRQIGGDLTTKRVTNRHPWVGSGLDGLGRAWTLEGHMYLNDSALTNAASAHHTRVAVVYWYGLERQTEYQRRQLAKRQLINKDMPLSVCT